MKYNAFKYLDDLKEAGLPTKQAEVMAKGMTESAESELATKRDLKELELRLIIKLGSIMILGITALAAIVKLA